jgi:DNA-binding FadR family transcriptional regulator
MEITPDGLSRFFADLAPELDERRRRVLCGATARLLGRGGIAAVSRAARMSRNTVAAGAAEIQAPDVRQGERVRRQGAGRRSTADREPQLLPALETMLAGERQDAGAPLQWTLRSSYEIAGELRRQGLAISPSSVGQLMRGLGYFATGRARPASERKRTDLYGQYRCVCEAAAAFGADGQPVISVRASRKELNGSLDVAEADDGTDGTWVWSSLDLSTVDFAIEAIKRWWTEVSPGRFPNATRLLVCTDRFGTDEEIRDGWQYYLAQLAHATGLEITIQRIPPGTWRWRDCEPQYSYTVTLAPSEGTAVRCEATIDLVTGLGPARAAGPVGGIAAAAAPAHRSGCACRYTVRPHPTAATTADRATADAGRSLVAADRGAADYGPASHAVTSGGTGGRSTAAEASPEAAGRHGGHTAGPRGLPDTAEPRKPKIAEIVAHNIARDISTRRLRPGARLPSETVALARFSVSRSSLREALRLLELLGVIRIRTGAGGGPVVGQVTSADFGSTTTFYYHLIGVTIREILEARCILEPALVRLAVDQADPVAKGKLRGYMNSWGGEDALRPAWLAPRERSRTAGFHRALIETGNAPLDLFSHSLQDVWTVRQYMEPFPLQAAPHHDNDHWMIAQAVLGNDGATAEGLMRAHMDYLYDFANAHWSSLMDEVIDWH